ncbi:hypothetical protein H696_03528 [Fonticula alba]|uniref:Essential protein Yae1 N-terminal domain-containing protein n=1 Tax=Fonticula alba TaxID=691883 RepID=A0A058Z736_FONAL|nr:hypothetical protein H696_03528 [Fonticula alba]KCV70065.1 hypothetical protein H696_03528 [Fonticula alba]|eukprot:XP_009495671.1 hypothetical protein H696_03528 [Fonticula alba]
MDSNDRPAHSGPRHPPGDLDDIFGSALNVEESLQEVGFEDGFNDGLKAGLFEGVDLGLAKGFQLGRELGFYRGISLACRRHYGEAITPRLLAALNALDEQPARVPLHDPQDPSLLEALAAVRSKYNIVMVQHRGRLRYGPGESPMSF